MIEFFCCKFYKNSLLIAGRGVAGVNRSKILTPQRWPARGGDGLRTTSGGARQNRLRAGWNQKIPRSGEFSYKNAPAAQSARLFTQPRADNVDRRRRAWLLTFECLQFVRASSESLFNWPRLLCARKNLAASTLFYYWIIACVIKCTRSLVCQETRRFLPTWLLYWFAHAEWTRHNWCLDRLKHFEFLLFRTWKIAFF